MSVPFVADIEDLPCAYVLFNLFNELGKRDEMLASIYYMTLRLL